MGGHTTVPEELPPPYTEPAQPIDRHEQSDLGSNRIEPLGLSPWQRRWNVEWLNDASIADTHYRYLRLERPRNRNSNVTRKEIEIARARAEKRVSDAIQAGCVSENSTMTRTRWQQATRRITWPVKQLVHEIKAFKGCWREYKNKDKLWRVTAVMEEQGETPRWQGEMKFTFQPGQYEEMRKTGEWIDFPSPQDIKWFWVTTPQGLKRLHATHNVHWGPFTDPSLQSMPFAMWNGHVVRNPGTQHIRAKGDFFSHFLEPPRCPHCR
ncbi:hypothetical protein HD806DRAFT_541935 [Xylariaceae sp. AK1471]|nr:hypothetical protein HD806DRAFT_541935 [Xylariaceae sp. AK1471]